MAEQAKLLVFIPKRPDITAEQFHEHWRTTHAQLALRIRALDSYIQNHRLATTPEEFPPAPFGLAPYLGVSAAWLAGPRAVDTMGADPDYLDGARLDEPNFMDIESKCNLICREYSLAGAQGRSAGAVKTFLMLRRPVAVPEPDFQEIWSDRHRWKQAADRTPLEDVTVNYPVPADYVNRRPAPFDLVIESWWQPGSRWDSGLSTAIALFDRPDRPSIREGSMAMAALEVRFL
jgi:EthD domain